MEAFADFADACFAFPEVRVFLVFPEFFFDFDEALAMFLLDYVAIMGLLVCGGYYLAAILRKSKTK